MKVDGSCHCGNIQFDAEIDADKVLVCHCTDCQTLTGSAFRVTAPAKAESLRMRGGSPRIYVKVAESGAKRVQAFCPLCGTPLYSSTEGNPTEFFLRVGTLRQRASLRPAVQVWRRSAVSWLGDLESVPGSPEQQALTIK
jgi:hypothetical protein